jgi:hypothetical protein
LDEEILGQHSTGLVDNRTKWLKKANAATFKLVATAGRLKLSSKIDLASGQGTQFSNEKVIDLYLRLRNHTITPILHQDSM